MRPARITLAALSAVLALGLTACGSSGSVPDGAVAVVNGTEITKDELDSLVGIAKKSYEEQDREFPKAGTPEYQNIQQQYLAFLVQREEFQQEADKLDVEVTEKDIDEAFQEVVKTRFGGDRKELEKALKQQGFTVESFRETLAASVLSEKLFEAVTKDEAVTDEEVLLYYTENQAQYEGVDFAASKKKADRVYGLLAGGADFAELAKKESQDPGSKDNGGKLTITRGETVPAFDKTAFELETGGLSKPVRTEYGYHVIEALSPVRTGGEKDSRDVRHILIAEKTTLNLDDVQAAIRTNLLQEKKNDVMRAWVDEVAKRYESKVNYATGFEPPPLPDDPTETE